MFILFGSRGYQRELGEVKGEKCLCPHCENVVRMRAVSIGRKFTLFFIPLFSFSSHYYIACPICGDSYEVSKLEAKTVTSQ